MFCKNCGSKLDNDVLGKYCPNCGFAIETKSELKQNFGFYPQYASAPYSYNNRDYKVNQLRSYVKILAVIQIIIGAIVLLLSGVIFIIRNYVIHNEYVMEGYTINEINVISKMLILIGIFLLLVSIFAIISGIGLLKRKKWSQATSMIIGALTILGFPLGTMYGVSTFYCLTRPEISEILGK